MPPMQQHRPVPQPPPRRTLRVRPLRAPHAANDNRRPPMAIARMACAWGLVTLGAGLAIAMWFSL